MEQLKSEKERLEGELSSAGQQMRAVVAEKQRLQLEVEALRRRVRAAVLLFHFFAFSFCFSLVVRVHCGVQGLCRGAGAAAGGGGSGRRVRAAVLLCLLVGVSQVATHWLPPAGVSRLRKCARTWHGCPC